MTFGQLIGLQRAHKTILDIQMRVGDTQLTNPDSQKTNPSTHLTNPSTHLTIPGAQLTSPGTRLQKVFQKYIKSAFSVSSCLSVREFANKSAASAASPDYIKFSAASPDYVKFQAVIKSAASAASLRGGRASGRLDHGLFSKYLGALAPKKIFIK